jgi:hypothetical protein
MDHQQSVIKHMVGQEAFSEGTRSQSALLGKRTLKLMLTFRTTRAFRPWLVKEECQLAGSSCRTKHIDPTVGNPRILRCCANADIQRKTEI